MKACFNVETQKYECPCKFDHSGLPSSFSSYSKYRKHTLTQGHQTWRDFYKLEDTICLPNCSYCFEPMNDPLDHQEKCSLRHVHKIDFQKDFENYMETQLPKMENCAECKSIVFQTTLARSRNWQNQMYCAFCFRLIHRATEMQNLRQLKMSLLILAHHQCPLCQCVIHSFESTIFEHLNPFYKQFNPQQLIRKGKSPSDVLMECKKEKIRLVHLVCAQIKTLLEMKLQLIQGREKKLQTISSVTLREEIKKKKAQVYETQIFPEIQTFIQTWTSKHISKSKPFFVRKNTNKKRKRSRSV